MGVCQLRYAKVVYITLSLMYGIRFQRNAGGAAPTGYLRRRQSRYALAGVLFSRFSSTVFRGDPTTAPDQFGQDVCLGAKTSEEAQTRNICGISSAISGTAAGGWIAPQICCWEFTFWVLICGFYLSMPSGAGVCIFSLLRSDLPEGSLVNSYNPDDTRSVKCCRVCWGLSARL